MAEDLPEASEAAVLLRWYVEAGVDAIVGERPVNQFAGLQPTAPSQPSAAPRQPVPTVRATPVAAPTPRPPLATSDLPDSLEELRRAVETFEGCGLRLTATNTVFGDGNPRGRVMLVGEAPGAEEDRQGIPFVGASGQLLDRMLAAIGLDRSQAYIANMLYWRPPGNRTPTPVEVAACLPFVERQIELVAPEILVLVGGAAAKALLGRSEGIMKLRGRWFTYATPRMSRPIPVIATFHPAYLLRSPGQKREAWRDLLAIREKLDGRDGTLAESKSIL